MHGHIPGNNPNKKRIERAQSSPDGTKPVVAYFDESEFLPARGYALIECRFIGGSKAVHIPDEVHEQQQYAIIRAMGPGKHHFDGSIIAPEWEEGDFVYAAIAQGRKIEVKDKKLVVLGTEFILGKFKTVPQVVLDEFDNEKEKQAAIASNGAVSEL